MYNYSSKGPESKKLSLIINKGVRMAKYQCSDENCDMEVMDIKCGKCGAELEYKTITRPDGTTVGVSECPSGCGRIKSPMCHGHDMVVV